MDHRQHKIARPLRKFPMSFGVLLVELYTSSAAETNQSRGLNISEQVLFIKPQVFLFQRSQSL